MNFLKLKSDALARFRVKYPQYWLDRLVEQVMADKQNVNAVTGQVLAILRCEPLGMELVMPGLNIVTTKGDKYYAQKAMGETPTDDFAGTNAGMRLGTGSTTPTKSDGDVTTENSAGRHAKDSTYPKTNDGDTDNTGAGVAVATWRYSYTTAEGNITSINEGAIVDNRTTPTGALTHFLFAASFTKTSSDTLKVFVNHSLTGV